MAETSDGKRQISGLFDIRNIIGALLGIYGVVLLLTALLASADTTTGKDSGSANLWVGLVLLVVGVAFLAWARWRPVEVSTDVVEEIEEREHEGPRE